MKGGFQDKIEVGKKSQFYKNVMKISTVDLNAYFLRKIYKKNI